MKQTRTQTLTHWLAELRGIVDILFSVDRHDRYQLSEIHDPRRPQPAPER